LTFVHLSELCVALLDRSYSEILIGCEEKKKRDTQSSCALLRVFSPGDTSFSRRRYSLFKVVSEREQVLVVPMTHLEDVRRNITETATEEDAGSLSLIDGNEYEGTEPPTVSVDITPQKISDVLRIPDSENKQVLPVSITVPIVAFLDPARISDDRIDTPIAAILPGQAGITKDRLENQQDVQNHEGSQRRAALDGAWSPLQVNGAIARASSDDLLSLQDALCFSRSKI